jgi:hypothetical protein
MHWLLVEETWNMLRDFCSKADLSNEYESKASGDR